VNFTPFLHTIGTKNSKRNEHLQDRFEAKKFGSITLAVPKDKVSLTKGGSVPGTLTFHGVSKAVTVKYEVSGGHVKASFGFEVMNHGIKEEDLCFEPKTKSICAKNHVEVEVEFDAKG
ncbi:MAG TPA: YceI family protein, partial [Polyangiaceae bacterium]